MAFAEQILTGASHHFPKHLPARDDPGYLGDQSVWSGSSGGSKRVSTRSEKTQRPQSSGTLA